MSEREELKERVDKREQRIDDRELAETLAAHGITIPIEPAGEGRCRLPVTAHFSLRRLPEGCAYKGGAARALLARAE